MALYEQLHIVVLTNKNAFTHSLEHLNVQKSLKHVPVLQEV